jgi:hypothetical protein
MHWRDRHFKISDKGRAPCWALARRRRGWEVEAISAATAKDVRERQERGLDDRTESGARPA